MKTLILKIILMLPIPLESKHLESFLQSHGIRARVEVVNLSEPLVLGNQLQYFYKLRQAFKRKKNEHIHVLTEPFIDSSGMENMLGLALESEKISMSVFNNENSLGLLRTRHSEIAMLHEILHVCGAKHTEEISVMHADAMRYVDTHSLEILPITKRQARRCFK